MKINAFSTAPAPAPGSSASPAPHAAHAKHGGDNSFARLLSRQHEAAPAPATSAAKETAATSAQKPRATSAKAPAPAPAGPRNEVRKPAETSNSEAKAAGKIAGDGEANAAAKATDPVVASTSGDETTKTPSSDAPPPPDGLNPWMALMQSLAAAPSAAAGPNAADTAAAALASAAAGGKAAGVYDAATTATATATATEASSTPPPGGADTRAAAVTTSAAALATSEAAQPEGSAAHFGNALAASLAAAPEAGAVGSELRARERDAASTALPADAAPSASFANLVANAPTPSHSAMSAEAAAAITLPTPVHSPEFAPSLAASVSVLAREGVQEAKINLHPAEMGPITVQIAVDGNQARVDFSADMAATRQALEAGLPELASALRDAGLTLSGGGVFDQARERPGASGEAEGGRRSRAGARADDGVTSVAAAPAAPRRVSLSGLDEYA